MKKIIVKFFIFSLLPILVIAVAVYLTGKKTGDFYKKFSSPSQSSLILGSSRAGGIDPRVMDSVLAKGNIPSHLYNYSFTWAHSPFGKAYYESIEKKLNPETKNGVFVITVEPTCIMVDKQNPDEEKFYVENDKSVAKTHFVNINPNIEYLVESYDESITKILNDRLIPPPNQVAEDYLEDNGRRVIKMIKDYAPEVRKKLNAQKMQEFDTRLQGLTLSQNRINYLKKIIELLQKHGKVYLVRLPISKVAADIEDKNCASFNAIIEKISTQYKTPYYNFIDKNNTFNYQWTDEVHQTPPSMNRFSKDLALKIAL